MVLKSARPPAAVEPLAWSIVMSRRLFASALVAASLGIAACSDKEVLAPRVLVGTPSPTHVANAGKIAFELELSPLFGIATANVDGTGFFRVTNDNGRHPSWSPDGHKIAYSSPLAPRGIFVVNEDGTNKTRLTDPALMAGCSDDMWPHWSPDGTKIVFTRACSTFGSNWRTVVVDVATGIVTQIANNGKYPQWSPDGLRISFVPHANPSSVFTANPDGSNVSLLYTHPSPGGCCPPDLEWSRNGSQIVFADEGGTGIYVMSPTGTNVTRIVNGSGTRRPSWSPDGSRIVYDSASSTGVGGATRALYIVNADGTGRVAIPHFLVPADHIGPAAIRSGKNADWYKPPLGGDTDGDGVSDATDNCTEVSNATQTNTDGDATGDACDIDDDNDGVSDATEIAAGSDPLNASSLPETCDGADNDLDGSVDDGFLNTDGDAQANCVDLDDDNDGVSDIDEIAAGSDPLVAGSSPETCDGVDNDVDGTVDEGFTNTDGDGQANCVDPDDDNDGVSDVDEIAAGSDPLVANSLPETCDGSDNDLDGTVDEGFTNTDGDAQADCVDSDDDGDGFTDAAEIAAGSNPLNASSAPEICDGADNDLDGSVDEGFTNTEGDSQANCVDTDDDNDGVTDATEGTSGSDPLNASSTPEVCDGADNDLNQGTDEGFLNTDGDAQANCVDPDDDNDNIFDEVDESPLVAGNRFRYNNTSGAITRVPSNGHLQLSRGHWPSGILIHATLDGGVIRGQIFEMTFDNKQYVWQTACFDCVPNGFDGQIADPPAQMRVESITGSSQMTAMLNGVPNVITINAGGEALITEYTSGGVLTDATVQASGVTGGVLVNGMAVPVGATSTIGALAVKASLSGGKAKALNLTGTFTPGASTDGLNPLTEHVSFLVGNYTWQIPAGSFTRASDGALTFQGSIGGVQLGIQLKRATNGTWSVKLNATPVNGLTVPTTIGVRIGNDVATSSG